MLEGGWDGVGLIGELVTRLDLRKPDYSQTYNVTNDSPPVYTVYSRVKGTLSLTLKVAFLKLEEPR